jgi:transcription antitermination factor NusG
MLEGFAMSEAQWYAVYTCARHEKRVAEQLAGRAVQHFLPLYGSSRRWQDRRVHLQLPLFPSYVFVRIPMRERMRVLEVPGVVHLVSVNGLPVPIPDQEMERLRMGLSGSPRVKPHPFLTVGRRVRIVRGPLEGLEGILLRRKGETRVVLSLDLIQRSISVDLETDAVEPIPFRGSRRCAEPRYSA